MVMRGANLEVFDLVDTRSYTIWVDCISLLSLNPSFLPDSDLAVFAGAGAPQYVNACKYTQSKEYNSRSPPHFTEYLIVSLSISSYQQS